MGRGAGGMLNMGSSRVSGSVDGSVACGLGWMMFGHNYKLLFNSKI